MSKRRKNRHHQRHRSTDHRIDYERLPNAALIFRGTLNPRANDIAQALLGERGCVSGVQFLKDHRVHLDSPYKSRTDWFWTHAGPVQHGWLASGQVTVCNDCGRPTERVNPAGRYQCEGCANFHQKFDKRTREARGTPAGEQVSDPALKAVAAGEVRSNRDSAAALKAALNEELLTAGEAAYHRIKTDGPLADAVRKLKEQVHHAA